MKIYTCIAKNLETALAIACKEHGVNIQVIYEKEVLFGIFNKKWIEIGYFDKEEDVPVKEKLSGGDEMSAELMSERRRLEALLFRNDFSVHYVHRALGEFVNSRLHARREFTADDNEEFILSQISRDFEDDFLTMANPPFVFIILSPFEFDRSQVISHIADNFSDPKIRLNPRNITLVNFGTSCAPRGKMKVFDCMDDVEKLYSLMDRDSGNDTLILNLAGRYYRDRRFFKRLEEHCSFPVFSNAFLFFPTYVKYADMKEQVKDFDMCGSMVFTDAKDMTTPGNVVSLCEEFGKRILFFDDGKKCVPPSAFDLMSHLSGFKVTY